MIRDTNLTKIAILATVLLGACKQGEASTSREVAAVDASGFPSGPYGDHDPALAHQLVDAGALLLDVRTPAEFERGHVEGAVNIDHRQVSARLDEIRERQGGDLDKPIVVYCRSGRRSGIAKEQLLEAGFARVTNLGGMNDW